MSGKRTMPLGVSVIIPSFQPDDRLLCTILSLISVGCKDFIVVNDGSGPDYDRIFNEATLLPGCTVLCHDTNRGKGAAIKTGIAYCLENKPDVKGVVTVDGDGHHFSEDVVSCAHRSLDMNSVVIGERSTDDATISRRGRFGNRVISRALDIVCDYQLHDPMSGLRGIPRRHFTSFLQTKGDTYDFETNMLLDCKRRKIPLRTFAIGSEYYADGKKSHYRLISDSLKISFEIIRYFAEQCKYTASSLTCYTFEYILFRILLGYFPMIGVMATNYICRGIAATANFEINKHLVFRSNNGSKVTIIKYFAVVILSMILSTEAIVIINRLFTTQNNTVAKYIKIPVDTVLFFFSYYLQKRWVFAPKKKGRGRRIL